MVVLLFVVTLLDSPFRSALIADIFSEDAYVNGAAVTQTAIQVGMVSGFALGGLVVVFLGRAFRPTGRRPSWRLRPQNAAARRSAWQTAACRCHKARGSLQRGSSSRLYTSRCHRGQRRPSSRWGCCADRELAAAVRACQHRNLTPAGDAWPASYRRAGGSSPFETAHGFLLPVMRGPERSSMAGS